MENAVRQRIKDVISQQKNLTLTAIGGSDAVKMQLSRQINGTTSISLGTILLILEKIPNLSADWLLRGEGNMYKDNEIIVDEDNYIVKQLFMQLNEKDRQIAILQEQNNKSLDIIHETERRRTEYKTKKSLSNNKDVISVETNYETVDSKINTGVIEGEELTTNETYDKNNSKVNIFHSKINDINVL